MTRYHEFSSLLRKIQCTNRYTQCSVLKDIATALPEANKDDMHKLLELLISTHDIEIQIKLFSVLAAYIINNGVNFEVIIKYNPLYDTVQNLLVRGLPMKAAVVLNFVMALLSCACDDGNSRSLATHARNMIRVSGCLNTMADMFSGSMMYQDTWIALCQSLAEACRGSEINQNYCSHLVPLCVQRCRQGNVDVCAVLQGLLHSHERNLQLFISSEGLTIFTRQLLQYNMGMQLLNTIVEKSSVAVSTLQSTDIVHHLRDFLHLYGPYSQMGQWSTIILYHLDKEENNILKEKAILDTPYQQESLGIVTSTNINNISSAQKNSKKTLNENFSKYINDDPNTDDLVEDQSSNKKKINRNTTSQTNHIFKSDNNPMRKHDDTTSLFQNVIKEVIYWKSKSYVNSDKQFHFDLPDKIACNPPNKTGPYIIKPQTNINSTKPKLQVKTHEKDLSFSFLMKETMQNSTIHKITCNDKIIESTFTPSKIYTGNNVSSYDKEVQIDDNSVFRTTGFDDETKIDLKNFQPAFISTPKRNKTFKSNRSKISHRSRVFKMQNRKQMKTPSRSKYLDNTKQEKSSTKKQLKHRSMSERFFQAINESCTTIVKSMKSIFRSKQANDDYNENDTSRDNENKVDDGSCSYSFTNYMRKRDALLDEDFSRQDDSSSSIYKVDSCKTCRDTIVLQQKMKRDDHLKQTVRKLKLGINLYGCDFKKISHAMWPRDRYMTPEMLYNLYRKLIIKGGHDNHSFRQKAHNAIRKR